MELLLSRQSKSIRAQGQEAKNMSRKCCYETRKLSGAVNSLMGLTRPLKFWVSKLEKPLQKVSIFQLEFQRGYT